MLILAVDTSGRSGSVTLARGDAGRFEVLGSRTAAGGTFSARLIPEIAAILEEHHATLSSVECYAVVSGPGSFTGLRIGLAAVKGLCEVIPRPIAALTMLEIMAWQGAQDVNQARQQGDIRVLTALDAGRSEFYAGLFEIMRNGSGAETEAARISEQLLTERELKNMVRTLGLPVITSDAKVVEFLRKNDLEVIVQTRPEADTVARLGLLKILRKQAIGAEELDAAYMRRTDAEILSESASGNKTK